MTNQNDETIIDAEVVIIETDEPPGSDLAIVQPPGGLAIPNNGGSWADMFLLWGVEKQIELMKTTRETMPMVARTPEFRAAVANELEKLVEAYDERVQAVG